MTELENYKADRDAYRLASQVLVNHLEKLREAGAEEHITGMVYAIEVLTECENAVQRLIEHEEQKGNV